MPSARAVLSAVTCLVTGAVLAACGTSAGSSGSGGPGSGGTSARPPSASGSANTATAPASSGAAPAAIGAATSAAARPKATAHRKPPPATRRPATGTPVAYAAGNPDGHASVPAAARAADTSQPTRTVGNGTPESCTSAAVVAAVAAGGVITFDCGPGPVTITMTSTAKVRNAVSRVVLDGGGKVTLSGGGARRILYMDTCDQAQGWTTSHCQDQSEPELTVQNLTFADGNSTGNTAEGGGGGAILVRGGRFKAVNTRFVNNRCDGTGPDLGGAAIRVLDQYHGLPVYITGSTFTGGVCSNGGALSSIGVSWTVLNSVFTGNSAIGTGANPARGGTPGGGSGGAIYTDGNTYDLLLDGTLVTHNSANEGGGAIFYVSNDRTGTLALRGSTLRSNPNRGFSTAGYPGIFFLGSGHPTVTTSSLS